MSVQLVISAIVPIVDGAQTFSRFVAAGDVLPNPPYASAADLPEALQGYVAQAEIPSQSANQMRHQLTLFGVCKYRRL